MWYPALWSLKENNVIENELPAPTSHRTQVVYYRVFYSLKEYLRTQRKMRLLGTKDERPNGCLKLCEIQ